MPRAIEECIVVITGASSGIGRATALEVARRKGTVVVAARRAQALEELAEECKALGGRALAVPTDVSYEAAVQALARRAVDTFGRIDVWVNNAAVTLFGRFEDTPLPDYRRVIETNLFGYIHGAYAVLPYFREQGGGVLVNVSSVIGRIGQPYTNAYTTSKFAIIGFSESLRQELRNAKDIHVCTVLPASIDTPVFQQGANYSGRAIKPIEPIYDPYTVAEAIVAVAQSPRREVVVGGNGRVALLAQRLAPALVERVAARKVEREHFQEQPAAAGSGNLFKPLTEYATVRGGWSRRQESRATLGIVTAALVLGLVFIAGLTKRPLPQGTVSRGQTWLRRTIQSK